MTAYTACIGLSAFLLFLVQPIMARLVLPLFGGSAAVWSACLVFFQTALLVGYLYAHLLVRRLGARAQGTLHLTLLAGSLAVLPLAPDPSWAPEGAGAPAARILALLATAIGLPYAVLSATSPLLSAWYAGRTGDPLPYRLYALSNAGSLLALVAYPFLVEPAVSVRAQALGWSAGYAAFAALCALVAFGVARRDTPPVAATGAAAPAPPLAVRALWLALPAFTSALLLAVTAHLTQNVAPIPFLWVAPLALYLLAFVLAFAPGHWYRPWLAWPLLAAALVAMAAALAHDGPGVPLGVLVPLFAAGLFLCCLVGHGELARLAPHPSRLTGFYLAISLGGALGAAAVALGAPVWLPADIELPLLLGGFAVVVPLAARAARPGPFGPVRWALLGGALAGALALALSLGETAHESAGDARVLVRNFYGTLRVADGFGVRLLHHGAITHGTQLLDPQLAGRPTTYYSPDSGVGRALRAAAERPGLHVGVVGLGAGTLAAYGRPGDRYRFYEINPLVVRLAETEFTYLGDTPAAVEVVLGDARLSLARERRQRFDLLAVDAFTSDAIPVHLLTREALALYLDHLADGGILAVHVSNRHLDLAPLVRRTAETLGVHVTMVDAYGAAPDDPGAYGSTWVLIARRAEALAHPLIREAAAPVPARPDLRPWTDDYSNLFQIVRWGGRGS